MAATVVVAIDPGPTGEERSAHEQVLSSFQRLQTVLKAIEILMSLTGDR